jgi:hypothetical protein
MTTGCVGDFSEAIGRELDDKRAVRIQIRFRTGSVRMMAGAARRGVSGLTRVQRAQRPNPRAFASPLVRAEARFVVRPALVQ